MTNKIMSNLVRATELVGHLEDRLEDKTDDGSLFDDQEADIKSALDQAELRGMKRAAILCQKNDHAKNWHYFYNLINEAIEKVNG